MNACHEDLTLWLDEDSDELIILDQTKLPGKEETVSISTARALYDAIRTLQVRGAPAIGVAAALGLYACAVRFEDETPEGFLYSLRKTKAFIARGRQRRTCSGRWNGSRKLRTAAQFRKC